MSMMVHEVRSMEASAVTAGSSAAVATAEEAAVEASPGISSSGIAADHMAQKMNGCRAKVGVWVCGTGVDATQRTGKDAAFCGVWLEVFGSQLKGFLTK